MKMLRRNWCEKYFVSDRELYKLFSEFTAMAMIAHQTKVESEPDSVQMKFMRTAEA